ncbi:MAG TPA: DNA methyltransferase [Candidatus Brocadiales bacterium]|nr:DNA methyltransferase [Candidatus Brocadiales bacterium]
MKRKKGSDKRPVEQYDHKGKDRLNNPPVGLVTPETDRDSGKKKYAYDPHLDPQLHWAGKAEHTSFEVPTVSLHVHERIDPRTIIEAVRKKNGNGGPIQDSLFASKDENPPLREAIEFYKHKHNWSNRIVAGDSLLVMNSLIEKEGMSGRVQMIYIDPPYGIDYGSNFQPFINNKTVIDGQDGSLTSEPEMLRAFRDTWELGIHSYLTYLRDRFYLSREMLSDTGCIFVQISSANLHHVRELLDEIFDNRNFISILTYRTRTMPMKSKLIDVAYDHIVWYGKDKSLFTTKFKPLFIKQDIEGDSNYRFIEFNDGSRREMTAEEINNHKLLPKGSKVYRLHYLKPSQYRPNQDFNFEFEGELFPPPGGNISKTPDGVHSWATTPEGMAQLVKAKRLQKSGSTLQYILYHYDYPVTPLNSVWIDTASELDKKYVVQTSELPIQRCILMSYQSRRLSL